VIELPGIGGRSAQQLAGKRPPGDNGRNGKMSIRVIGTGFGRTGTDSMREALKILGFGTWLLVPNLGDGWAPLCAHLGVSVPSQPYPSRNSSSDFRATFSIN
jgi:Sulfotransferase domain